MLQLSEVLDKVVTLWILTSAQSKVIVYQTVLLSRDPPKVAHAPKTAAHKKHPMDILHEEKYVHGIVLALPKPNIAQVFKTAKY